jgi:hypothetical protein
MIAANPRVPKWNAKTKRPPGNWVASSSRENSSNGALKSVKTFCANLMSLKTRVSRDFCEINVFVFNTLQNQSIPAVSVAI